MTIEELARIVAETVTKYIFLERQRVLALCFDEANKTELLEAARSINGKADYVAASNIDSAGENYDVMFVDYIRFPDVAEAALGLAFSPWGRLAGGMVSRGKPVFQLKKTPGSAELNPACRAALGCYWKQLDSLGVVLLDSGGPDPAGAADRGVKETPYAGNVLSRRDLLRHTREGRLVIARGVLVTALAADTARDRNIEIVRRE